MSISSSSRIPCGSNFCKRTSETDKVDIESGSPTRIETETKPAVQSVRTPLETITCTETYGTCLTDVINQGILEAIFTFNNSKRDIEIMPNTFSNQEYMPFFLTPEGFINSGDKINTPDQNNKAENTTEDNKASAGADNEKAATNLMTPITGYRANNLSETYYDLMSSEYTQAIPNELVVNKASYDNIAAPFVKKILDYLNTNSSLIPQAAKNDNDGNLKDDFKTSINESIKNSLDDKTILFKDLINLPFNIGKDLIIENQDNTNDGETKNDDQIINYKFGFDSNNIGEEAQQTKVIFTIRDLLTQHLSNIGRNSYNKLDYNLNNGISSYIGRGCMSTMGMLRSTTLPVVSTGIPLYFSGDATTLSTTLSGTLILVIFMESLFGKTKEIDSLSDDRHLKDIYSGKGLPRKNEKVFALLYNIFTKAIPMAYSKKPGNTIFYSLVFTMFQIVTTTLFGTKTKGNHDIKESLKKHTTPQDLIKKDDDGVFENNKNEEKFTNKDGLQIGIDPNRTSRREPKIN